MKKSVVLIILDGFGVSPEEEGNAVLAASLPFLFKLLGTYPKTLLSASSEAVGLPFGEMGNSEVGHFNLGTGRVVMQDLSRINKAIEDGSFFKNQALSSAALKSQEKNSAIHLIGLCSPGGIHSHFNHLFALLLFFKKMGNKKVFIHLITDGRDTPPQAALDYLSQIEKQIKKLSLGKIVSISGRYYAMDRDNHWERTKKAYLAMIGKTEEKAKNPKEAIEKAYQKGETDEFITPISILNQPSILKEDVIIFFNFRADRTRQLWHLFVNTPEFKNCFFVSFTSYGQEPIPNCKIAFFAEKTENQLAKVLASNHLTQLHLAETEKYAHVTYFFNGGIEGTFKGESQVLIPSPSIPTYDQKPEMSAGEIVKKAISLISQYDFTVINFANPDMVGHTGNFQAALKALETVDNCLSQIVTQCLLDDKTILITADHGNVETMINPETGEPNKEHTTNPVFLILVDKALKKGGQMFLKDDFISFASLQAVGLLADVAPTILEIMGLSKPKEMTGESLLTQLE